MNEEQILKQAVETFGKEHQIDKLIEEMGEVMQALIRRRYNPTKQNSSNCEEELADLSIVLDQMKYIFDAENIEVWRIAKLKRLEIRLNGMI